MGVIAKKHKGAWWVFINHHGKRRTKKVGEKAAALELKAKVEARMSAGDLGVLDKPGLTFAEATERWLEGYVKPCLKVRSHELYSGITTRYLLPALGNVCLRDITRSRLRDFVTDLHAKGLSRSYIRNILAALSGILQQAVEDEHLDYNPAARLGRYTGRQNKEIEEKPPVKYWTEEQFTRILARTQQEYPAWHDLFATMLWTGFRAGEALGLQWDDIDQEGQVIYVRRSVYERGREIRRGSPKGNKVRQVQMAPQLGKLLSDRKSRLEAEATVAGQAPPAWVFPGKGDNPARYHVAWRVLAHVLDLENIPRYPRMMTHGFRHSMATWILQKAPTVGALPYISRQLGHSSVKLTLDVYSHVIPEENRHLSEWLANATTRNPGATSDEPETEIATTTGPELPFMSSTS